MIKIWVMDSLQGEDKGEGGINTLSIAGCWLRIGKIKNWTTAGAYS